jgi:hypothetical protein
MVNEELDLDQEESEVNEKRKREAVEPAIYEICETFRVVIDDSDTMILQKKSKYTDGTENWIFDGYFQDWEAMFREVLKSLPKVMALRKGSGNLLDLIQIIKDANKIVIEWFAPKLNK